MQLRPTTPSSINSEVKRLRRCLEVESFCQYINVEPIGTYNHCFQNVLAHIKVNGGEMVLGWVIWQLPNTFTEGEYHAVWKKDSNLTDITVKPDGETKIVFLPDLRMTFVPEDSYKVPNWMMFLRQPVQKWCINRAVDPDVVCIHTKLSGFEYLKQYPW